MSAKLFNLNSEFDSMLVSGPYCDNSLNGEPPCADSSDSGHDVWQAVYFLKPDFIGFAGHFPEYPLMPALMQTLMGAHMLETALGRKISVESLPIAKFTGQARPGDELFCKAHLIENKGDSQDVWEFKITRRQMDAEVEPKLISSFRLALRA